MTPTAKQNGLRGQRAKGPKRKACTHLLELWFSHSVMSNSLWRHGWQDTRLPRPSPTPGVYWNSYPLSQWCHPTISSIDPFSSHLQSFPVSGPFEMSQPFTSGSQSIGVSASASVLPLNIQDWFPLGLTGWISLQSKGLSRVFQHHSSKVPILQCTAFFIVQLSHPYVTTGKTIAFIRQTFVGKVMSLLFNMLSNLVITFHTRSKCLLISWLQSPSAVILEPRKLWAKPQVVGKGLIWQTQNISEIRQPKLSRLICSLYMASTILFLYCVDFKWSNSPTFCHCSVFRPNIFPWQLSRCFEIPKLGESTRIWQIYHYLAFIQILLVCSA